MTSEKYRSDYKIHDWVVRRPGTLGNMDGNAAAGIVSKFEECNGHTMVTVQFRSHSETFVADTYVYNGGRTWTKR